MTAFLQHTSPKAKGAFLIVDPSSSGDGWTQNYDTVQCVHCQKHWAIEPGSGKRRGYCLNCGGPTCGARPCEEHCIPAEKMLEMMEAKFRADTDYDRILTEMAAER